MLNIQKKVQNALKIIIIHLTLSYFPIPIVNKVALPGIHLGL